MNQHYPNRRNLLKTSVLGFLAVSVPHTDLLGKSIRPVCLTPTSRPGFPHIDPEIAETVVGASHSNLEKVKELVDKRPELARASWEWQFGDWESAIGAASHTGRRDIVQYLMEKGARPTIFTFAMLGAYDIVKAMIESYPGIQETAGPHGISLLRHARIGNRMEDQMSAKEKNNLKRLIDYLESLGNANGKTYPEVSAEDQEKYLGDYKYGAGPKEGVSVSTNMREILSLGPLGGFGGALQKTGAHEFIFEAAPSVSVTFHLEGDQVSGLTIKEPDLETRAKKVS